MPSWTELVNEVDALGRSVNQLLDEVRKRYIAELSQLTGRNTIVYYSGWLHKQAPAARPLLSINDADKNAFMAVMHNLKREQGLDLILHTPGGGVAATESLVEYLDDMFHGDMRAIVPQLAMSGGTMIALASKQIVMGKHSSLGPIDPAIGPYPAHAVIEEFKTAREDILKDPRTVPLWTPILNKYNPTFINQCQKAIDWSRAVARESLINNMFKGQDDATDRAEHVVEQLGNPSVSKSHDRHIGLKTAQEMGLDILPLEDEQALQSAVLSVHHACLLTLAQTNIAKLVENNIGTAYPTRLSLPDNR